MARCSVCGESAGFLSIHNECALLIEQGHTNEQVVASRADRIAPPNGVRDIAHQVVATGETLIVLAGCLLVLLVVGAGILAVTLGSSSDGAAQVFEFIAGAVFGGFLGAILFTWLKLQVTTAKLLAIHLDR